jgi:N-acetylglucosaminyl-diphospho-decaprenol L-rhamnosyltransferase
MASGLVTVVIPVHGGYTLTASCLEHLRAQSLAHDVVVVDDASPDDTPQRIAAAFPEVQLERQPVNRGFAAACNRGIAVSSGELVVLLNNDVDVRPDFLARLVAPLRDDPRLGSVAALLVTPGGATIDSLGLAVDRTAAGFPRLQGAPAAAANGGAQPPLVGPSGGAAAYRRSALMAAGPLDEHIFMYQEDLDLALRLRGAGWGAAAAPDAVGVHHGSATAQRRSAFQRRTAGWSRGYLLRRYGVLRGRAALTALLTELVVVAGDAVISRDLAALRGRVAGWRAARGMPRRALPPGVMSERGFAASLRLRRADYAAAAAGGAELRSGRGD